MYKEKDIDKVINKIVKQNQLNDLDYDIFVRNQAVIISKLTDVHWKTIVIFLNNLKTLGFDFNGMFQHKPIGQIMMNYESFIKLQIYETLFNLGMSLSICKRLFHQPIHVSNYLCLIENVTLYGFSNESWYDILQLFCENQFIEELFKQNVNLATFIFMSHHYEPDNRVINMLVKHDTNKRIQSSLMLGRNRQIKQVLYESYNDIYNLIF